MYPQRKLLTIISEYQVFKKKIIPIVLKIFQKIEKKMKISQLNPQGHY